MRLRRTMLMIPVLLALGVAGSAPVALAQADLVLTNGRVITVDSRDRVVSAIAIRAGKIIAVGTDAQVNALAVSSTRRVDLHGLAVTPGLLDAHAHFGGGGAERLLLADVAFPTVKSITDVQAVIAAKVKALAPGAWLLGRGWDEGKLAERRMLTAKDLDAVSPANPVFLEHTTGHYGVGNSLAMQLAKIGRETKDPPNGTIDRDASGMPTGVLKEAAQLVMASLIAPFTPSQIEDGMRDLAHAFNAEGMTGLKDPGITDETWDSYRRVLGAGGLTVRVFALWQGGTTVREAEHLIARRAAMTRPYESTGDDHLIAGGVKLYMDGSGGARTAWMHDEWNKNFTSVDSGNRGYPAANPDTLRLLIRMYHDAGLHVAVHSVGDQAIDATVDAFAEAMRANPKPGLRHAIIHDNIPTPHALDVMAELQQKFDAGYAEPSATFIWWIGDTYAANFGPVRSLHLNPFATFRARGLLWANGSDFPVTPFPARYGIWSAVARRTLLDATGDPFGRAESVNVHDALRAVTIWAAHQMFLEKKIGSLEVGKYADLAVWDRDPYAVPTDQLKEMRCQLTIFDGKVVYRAPDASITVTTPK